MVEEKNIYEMSGTVSHLQRFLSLTFTIFSFNCSTVLLQKVKKKNEKRNMQIATNTRCLTSSYKRKYHFLGGNDANKDNGDR